MFSVFTSHKHRKPVFSVFAEHRCVMTWCLQKKCHCVMVCHLLVAGVSGLHGELSSSANCSKCLASRSLVCPLPAIQGDFLVTFIHHYTTLGDMSVTFVHHTTHGDMSVTFVNHTTHGDMAVTCVHHTTHGDMSVTCVHHTTHGDMSVTFVQHQSHNTGSHLGDIWTTPLKKG